MLRSILLIAGLLAGSAQANRIDFNQIAPGTQFFYGGKGNPPQKCASIAA